MTTMHSLGGSSRGFDPIASWREGRRKVVVLEQCTDMPSFYEGQWIVREGRFYEVVRLLGRQTFQERSTLGLVLKEV